MLVTVVNSASLSTLVVVVSGSCGVSVSETVVTDSAAGTLSLGSSAFGSDFSDSVDPALLGTGVPETPLAACA